MITAVSSFFTCKDRQAMVLALWKAFVLNKKRCHFGFRSEAGFSFMPTPCSGVLRSSSIVLMSGLLTRKRTVCQRLIPAAFLTTSWKSIYGLNPIPPGGFSPPPPPPMDKILCMAYIVSRWALSSYDVHLLHISNNEISFPHKYGTRCRHGNHFKIIGLERSI